MPQYLLDTNILLHYIRRDALSQDIEARYHLHISSPPPLISVVTQGEIRSLAEQLHWGEARKRHLTLLLDTCIVLPLGLPGLIGAYAAIDAHNVSVGRKIGDNDVWIAATAHSTKARLLTTDKDFDHLHSLFLLRDWIDPRAHY